MSIDGVSGATTGAQEPRLPRFNGAVDEHRRSRRIGDAHAAPAPAASMGPSMSIDGVWPLRRPKRRRPRRFNGAVDEHRRSHEDEDGGDPRAADASMGPSMSIDGVARRSRSRSRSRRLLQWGRR